MAYISIEDFKLGMDRRKLRANGAPGSLWFLQNGHITAGGEIERCKKFVTTFELPAGTIGLASINNLLYVFGAGANPGGLPGGVLYQRLQHPSSPGATITDILSWDAFDGGLYVVAEFNDGSVHQYYDGRRVSSWDALAASIGSNDNIAQVFAQKINEDPDFTATASGNQITITRSVPGVEFTIETATTNRGAADDQELAVTLLNSALEARDETSAVAIFDIEEGTSSPGTNKITSVKVNGVQVLNTAVDWATSNSVTATAVAAQINSYNSTPEYTATASAFRVRVFPAAGLGAAPNGFKLAVGKGGDVEFTIQQHMSGGVDARLAEAMSYRVTVSGTFEPNDVFDIILDGKRFRVRASSSGTGRFVKTFKRKMYSTAATLLYFCEVNNPKAWGSGIGSGFLNMSEHAVGNEPLQAIAEYEGKLAIFSRNSVRLWHVFEDDDQNTFDQTVEGAGCDAPLSITRYGNLDVFYLSNTGIRSLRPRDSSGTAAVGDIGTPIDKFVQDHIAGLSETQFRQAKAIIEPRDGRYWLALGDRIYVFSNFPGNRVSAWSYYSPGFSVDAFCKRGIDLYVRAGNTIYLYGGEGGTTYPDVDELPVIARLPFLSAGTPGTRKAFFGVNAAFEGQWELKMYPDPTRPDAFVSSGVLASTTFGDEAVPTEFWSTHVAPELVCRSAGYARFSSMMIHYRDPFEKGGKS